MELFGKEYDAENLLKTAKEKGRLLCGYYNENYQLDIDGHNCVVRRPIDGAEDMDLGFVREEEVLELLAGSGIRLPTVHGVSQNPYFYVENFIEGDVVNDTHPRGTILPDFFIPDVLEMKSRLWITDYKPLLKFFPSDWPAGDDVGGFFERNAGKVGEIWNRFKDSYKRLYSVFGAPSDPLDFFSDFAPLFTPRPLVLAHSDVHRKNCIIRDGKTWFLDWERALIADPVYDLAVHMHKMYYTAEESKRFIRIAKEVLPERFIKGIDKDLERYLLLERAKSFVVDTVRAHRHVTDPNESPDVQDYVVNQFARKINQVQEIWGGKLFNPDEIREIMAAFTPE